MEKTISYLNSKTWYRLVKVLYILLFVISVFGLNIGNYFGNGVKKVDLEKTKIYCNIKDKKIFSPKDIYSNFALYPEDFVNGSFDYEHFFRGYYSQNKVTDILKKCGDTSTLDLFAKQRAVEITKGEKDYDRELVHKEVEKITGGYKSDSEKADLLDFSVHLFEIYPVFSYTYFIIFFLVGNLSIIFIFELMKRVFYYVVCGSLKPKK